MLHHNHITHQAIIGESKIIFLTITQWHNSPITLPLSHKLTEGRLDRIVSLTALLPADTILVSKSGFLQSGESKMIHPAVLHRMLPTIVPLVFDWVTSVENDLWDISRPLTAGEKAEATALGVEHPDSIRVAVVESLPEPSAELKHLAEQLRILTTGTLSLTLGRIIVIKANAPDRPELVRHGLVHAVQIERCGGVRAFLREYFAQCLEYGKDNCPMEVEARTKVDDLSAHRV